MYLTKGMFRDNLNTRFRLTADGAEPYGLELMELVEFQTPPKQEQFSLRFRGDRSQVFPQQLYAMKHEEMGEFELFLVPVARDDSGTIYEAVFNRFIDEQSQEQDQQKAS
jgi:hypothetical protein